MTELLLDTCAVIWAGNGTALAPRARDAINSGSAIFASPFVAWELGMLVARGRLRMPHTPDIWFRTFLERSGVLRAEMTAEILVASSFLPATPPRDPADRIMIATARAADLTLMTRDKKILAYAGDGHVKAIAC